MTPASSQKCPKQNSITSSILSNLLPIKFLVLEKFTGYFVAQARNLKFVLESSFVFISHIYSQSQSSVSLLNFLRLHLYCSSSVLAIIYDSGSCSYTSLNSPHPIPFPSFQYILHTAARGTLLEITSGLAIHSLAQYSVR